MWVYNYFRKIQFKKVIACLLAQGGAGSKEEMFFVKSNDGSDLTVFWFHGSKWPFVWVSLFYFQMS